MKDPARLAAIAEPVMFQARVSVRFIYAPSRWLYPLLSRWDLGVRTDSFQITNWVYGNPDRARTTFIHSADCVMWQATTDGRDWIVVSGPTYIRSKVEFDFSTEGQNADAWNALVLSGVRGMAGPPDATNTADPPRRPRGRPPRHHRQTRPRHRRHRPPLHATSRRGSSRSPSSPPSSVQPFLFAVTARFTIGHLAPTISGVQTTQWTLNPDRTQVTWSGNVTATGANPTLNGDTIEVQLVLPNRTQVSSTDVALPPLNKGTNPLGPVDVAVSGAPAAVQCVAFVASPQDR